MENKKLYFYIANGGDGSAYLRLFGSKKDAQKAMDDESEGFCENEIYNSVDIQKYKPEVLLPCGLHFDSESLRECFICE